MAKKRAREELWGLTPSSAFSLMLMLRGPRSGADKATLTELHVAKYIVPTAKDTLWEPRYRLTSAGRAISKEFKRRDAQERVDARLRYQELQRLAELAQELRSVTVDDEEDEEDLADEGEYDPEVANDYYDADCGRWVPDGHEVCDACAGTGTVTYDHDLEVVCMECDGEGYMPRRMVDI